MTHLFTELERIKSALNIRDEKPKASPASWSNTVNTEREYKPIGDGATYWTDKSGFSIRRDDVPEDVIAKWEAGSIEPTE